MAQPPVLPIMARALSRSIPFVSMRRFAENVAIAGSLSAEFDTIEGFADTNQFDSVGAYPGGAAVQHAVGPFLDSLIFADGATELTVFYAVDRGCSYHQIAPATGIPANTALNISGLRITGRFVKVTLTNTAGVQIAVEFGVYVRSA